jgi:hypothetical protein
MVLVNRSSLENEREHPQFDMIHRDYFDYITDSNGGELTVQMFWRIMLASAEQIEGLRDLVCPLVEERLPCPACRTNNLRGSPKLINTSFDSSCSGVQKFLDDYRSVTSHETTDQCEKCRQTLNRKQTEYVTKPLFLVIDVEEATFYKENSQGGSDIHVDFLAFGAQFRIYRNTIAYNLVGRIQISETCKSPHFVAYVRPASFPHSVYYYNDMLGGCMYKLSLDRFAVCRKMYGTVALVYVREEAIVPDSGGQTSV